MAENYVLLETINLTQNVSSVTFDNIPQTGYTDLKVVVSGRSIRTGTDRSNDFLLTFNGTTSGYSRKDVGDSPVRSTGGTGLSNIGRIQMPSDDATSDTFGSAEISILNYNSSNYKSISIDSVGEDNNSYSPAWLVSGLWSNNASITSITLTADQSGTIVANSTFSLYGIAALGTTPVTAPFATGGNIVANDGTYWYHAFLSSGTFTPLKTLSCDVLTIAGGGGGGQDSVRGGGGGAGGIFYATAQSVLTAKTVTIGAGGTGGTDGSVANAAGSNSTFQGLTSAIGGGRGGGDNITGTKVGGNGGSGGGGTTTNSQPSTSFAGGSSTQTGTGGTGYGNAGGAGGNNGASGGGGGGAGAAGTGNISSYGVGGTGGAGLNTWSAWASATNTGVSGYYAGGGGGGGTGGNYGAGGAGGGGRAGDNNGVAVSGTANTGGGGGGRGGDLFAGAGGSGIVIVRYAMV